MPISERPIRSNSYQWIIHEVVCTDIVWDSFTNQNSIGFALNPWQYDEELDELEEKLRIEFWKLAEEILTPRQLEVCQMLSEGMTQWDIAKKLGVNQSSINKTLFGNMDYQHKDKHGKYLSYGGLRKKMRKAMEEKPIFQELFDRMEEVRNEKL